MSTTAASAGIAASIAAAAESERTAAGAEPMSMQAIHQDCYGTSEQLALTTIDRPSPEAGQVLVKVTAAGVDRGVWHLMTGLPLVVRLGFGLRRPKQPVPGLDLAGTVVEVGADVSDFAVGDEVYGIGTGAYAEYAIAEVSKLAHRPETVTAEQAATLAVSGATASQAVLEIGRAKAGQRVLVLGASGGVGSLATQIAHAHGLHVTGVASAAKAGAVRSFGADVVLDYATDDFAAQEPFDLIIDTGGRNPLRRLRRALTPKGTLVIVGGEGGNRLTGGFGRSIRAALLSPFVSHRLVMFLSDEHAASWASLHELVTSGSITAPVDRTYALADVPAALDDLTAGRISGKAVITVA
ncbi:MAG: NAD(P)-dependent alcohol dehydrogenase [Acidimicrobiales bacterium]|nr:NAD(P)-dependent alcohol dehydrogenase [Acidimicrobiales bacterium]